MTVDLTANLAVIVAGIAALAGLLAPALRRMHRVERGVGEIWRGFFGEPARDGEPARPGVMEHLAAQDAELAAIKRKLGIGEPEH